MMDYQIQPNTRRCVVTGRELHVGERFYTALLEEGNVFQRQDYSQEAWQGPPAGAFSFWTGKVPADEDARKPRFDDDLLEECFHRLEGQSDQGKINFRYVIALLLIRRKRFKFEHTVLEDGMEKIAIHCLRGGGRYLVVNPRLTEDQMTQVQEEVFQVLGWN
jgi:hypothetical protein